MKTRLASAVGDEQALKIYLALLDHTRQIVSEVKADRLLFYSEHIDRDDQWPETYFQKFLQQGNDLGERMHHAFQTAFQNYSKVMIIGSDCASLSNEIIEEAFTALEHSPFVVGPAMDGGYYLLGMNAFEPSVFKKIEWSTDKVFNQTIKAIKKVKQSCYLLHELSDIDYKEDWDEYGWELD